MKTNFQQKLIVSFLIIFIFFTAGIIIFEQHRAKQYKTEALQEKLDAYADAVSKYVSQDTSASPDSLLAILPDNLRLTLMDRSGKVTFDNVSADITALDDHSARPEIIDAVNTGSGTFIRTSASNDRPYLYYAKDYGDAVIVRVALPYDIRVRHFLKPDNGFLYFTIALFIAGLGFIFYVGNRFGRSIRQLRDFSQALNDKTEKLDIPIFPNDELGEIGNRIVNDFYGMRESENRLAREREKLLLHIQTSAEGICFFNPDSTVAFYNGLFLQYFNIISNDPVSAGRRILQDSIFSQVTGFLGNPGNDDYFETRINRYGKEFMLRINIFGDGSFELILTDITSQEKTRRLKREMTGNIAHELRTPVTSIRGFLEIVLNNEMGEEKRHEYLQRAFIQTQTLSGLISDMGLLTKIEERANSFGFGEVNVRQVIDKVQSDTAAELARKNITFTADIPDDMTVKGNGNLLYSVFRNLTDNTAHHAGENVAINIKVQDIKDGMAYFSFADNGKGIKDAAHLNRLFERFYRVSEGRTRDTGGSGLGLSIVKNAIQLHGGTITARNGKSNGLEFLFSIPID